MEPSSWRWPGALSGRHVAVLLLLGCATRSRVCDATAPVATYEVVKKYPHESGCFTEGFSVNHTEGIAPEVFESCGLTGRSYVRRYDLESGQTKQRVGLEAKYFGEGAVLLGDSLLVLTYQHHEMLEMDAKTLQVLRTHPFPYGEGWGLTTDGCDLLATTGSSYLFRLRRSTTNGLFELANKVQVTHEGRPLRMLNEIEYITPKLWVNEWITNRIWRVDPLTGHCEMQIDIGKLHKWRGQATPNGIAYSPSLGADLLLVTGKLWPQIFSLRFKVTDLCGGQTQSVTCPSAPPSACWHNTNPLTVPTPVAPVAPLAPVAPTAKPTALAATEPPDTAATPVATPVATPAPVINMSEMTDLSKLPKGLTVISALMGAFLFCFAGGAVIVIRQLRSRRREMLYRHRVEQTEDA